MYQVAEVQVKASVINKERGRLFTDAVDVFLSPLRSSFILNRAH